jgi:hypothetical protein
VEYPSPVIESSFSATYTQHYDDNELSTAFNPDDNSLIIRHPFEFEQIQRSIGDLYLPFIPPEYNELVQHYIQHVVKNQARLPHLTGIKKDC